MSELSVEFFGVRGSCPTPGAGTANVGGNTPSTMVRVGHGSCLILDAGTGIVPLARTLASPVREVRLFLSHLHWDHIQGLPFFTPLYGQAHLTIHSAAAPELVRRTLAMQMSEPVFPVDLQALGARLEIIQVNEPWQWGGARCEPLELTHPGGCSGLKIASGSRSVVYATDHEIGDSRVDAHLLASAAGCDALILDAHYDAEQKRTKKGWGHSAWFEAAELARRADVGTLYLFHHDPARDDEALEQICRSAREIFPRTELAKEGLRIEF